MQGKRFLYFLPMIGTDIISISIFGVRIDEPMATATDILVSVCCMYFGLRLHQQGKDFRAIRIFSYYFMVMSLATLMGGILGHAFMYRLSTLWKLPGWITSMLSIMLIERAAIHHTRHLFGTKTFKILRAVNIIELIIFMILSIVTLNFFFVEIHSTYGLLFVVGGLEFLHYRKMKTDCSKQILIGLALAGLAAVVFSSKLILHKWFNHLALSHVFMAVASYFFYRGAKGMKDLTTT